MGNRGWRSNTGGDGALWATGDGGATRGVMGCCGVVVAGMGWGWGWQLVEGKDVQTEERILCELVMASMMEVRWRGWMAEERENERE